ncbi:MAG: flagellar basal body rod protein FlgC [Armatimonadetes bacterium]|nr:flagellar basal body rod protein FlgC [Armatimonadota bacterium]
MGFFDSVDISASGMTAERFKMDVIAQNIANVNTSKTVSGEPYRRHMAIVTPDYNEQKFVVPVGEFDSEEPKLQGKGVKVSGVATDPSDAKRVYDPSHPDADKDGYVLMPNVDIITEMTSMIQASRAYEANATAIESAKGMAMKALEMGSR